MKGKCIFCGKQLVEDTNDDQICDDHEETRNELSNGKGEDEIDE